MNPAVGASTATARIGNVSWSVDAESVASVTLCRPPSNFLEEADVVALGDALQVARGAGARAIVLATEGKNFCAGASLESKQGGGVDFGMYDHIPRLFDGNVPIVACVQGAAVGAGLGLALIADFRVVSPRSRFVAPFTRLGFHHGFGITATLSRVVGQQRALEMLYTGTPVDGVTARRIGLADRVVVDPDDLVEESFAFARSIASSAPLAVSETRATLRGDLAEAVREALSAERKVQQRLMHTADFVEGVAAALERRDPDFVGR